MAGKKKSPSLVFLRNETDIFSESGYDVSVQSTDYTHYYPTSSIGDSSIPISFFIQGDDLHYIDLSQTAIFIRGRVLDNANNAVPVYNKETRVAPVNNFLHSLFEQCVVHLNETQITSSTNLYMYRALIETILAFSGDSTDTIGATSFYFKEHTNLYDPANEEPWKARQALIQGGNEFDLIGRPHLDICAQTRYLIPGVDIRFTFHRTRPEFYMMQQKTDLKYRFDITQARLIVKRHTLLPSILANHLKLWDNGFAATYPMRRAELKSYTLATGTTQNVNENILNGHLPDRIIIALVLTSYIHGEYNKNSAFFEPFDIGQLSVTCNGNQIYHQTYNLNFKKLQYTEPYYNLFSALGTDMWSDGPHITLQDFKTGRTMFCFNLRDYKDGFCVPRYGNVRIEMKFNTALEKSVTVLVHADYQSVLQIDNNKNVFFKDFSSTSE